MPSGERPSGGRPPGVPLSLEQRQWLEKQWRSAGLTQGEVATRAGLGLKLVSRIVNEVNGRYNAKSVAAIAFVVGISPAALARRGFPEPVVSRAEELEELYADSEDTYTDAIRSTMQPRYLGRGGR
jgi:transcriptional regulator with XRE-family HTH domain